jgi:hypothetical protein
VCSRLAQKVAALAGGLVVRLVVVRAVVCCSARLPGAELDVVTHSFWQLGGAAGGLGQAKALGHIGVVATVVTCERRARVKKTARKGW